MATSYSKPPTKEAENLLRKLLSGKFSTTQLYKIAEELGAEIGGPSIMGKNDLADAITRNTPNNKFPQLVAIALGEGNIRPQQRPALQADEVRLRAFCQPAEASANVPAPIQKPAENKRKDALSVPNPLSSDAEELDSLLSWWNSTLSDLNSSRGLFLTREAMPPFIKAMAQGARMIHKHAPWLAPAWNDAKHKPSGRMAELEAQTDTVLVDAMIREMSDRLVLLGSLKEHLASDTYQPNTTPSSSPDKQAMTKEDKTPRLKNPAAQTQPASVAAAAKPQEGDDMADVIIVCALPSPELEKVRATGSAKWEKITHHEEDPHIYYKTTYKTIKGNNIRVIAGAPTQMGLPAAAVLATKMILNFRPKLVAMVGIAAGASKKKQGYGNILAADMTFDYGAGKIIDDNGEIKFQPDHSPLPIDTRLKSLLLNWQSQRTELDEIYKGWQGEPPNTVLNMHVGPLGSGAAVIDAKQPITTVLSNWRKLVGIEMEAYGVHRACSDTISPAPMFICLKSICDFAQKKADKWQKYAAYTAAEFFYRFLINEWENLYLDKGRAHSGSQSASISVVPTEPHPHDVRLLGKLRSLLSPRFQEFLVNHNFGNRFPVKTLSPLHDIVDEWVGAAHRFHDSQVQEAFERLKAKIAHLVDLVNERIHVDLHNKVEIGSPLSDWDKQRGISKTTRQGIHAMNNAARELMLEIQHFEEVARGRIRV